MGVLLLYNKFKQIGIFPNWYDLYKNYTYDVIINYDIERRCLKLNLREKIYLMSFWSWLE
jgi:hypothetical protein